MNNLLKCLQGKKTYIASGCLVLVSAGGLYCGALSDAQSFAVLAAAFGFIGLGDKSDRAARMLADFIESEKAKNSSALSSSPKAQEVAK